VDVTIVVASYGDLEWLDIATRRAAPSAFAQNVPVVTVHGLTLHGARNAGLAQVETEYVVFLDADDELGYGYCEILAAGSADLRVPSVAYVSPSGRPRAPYVPKVAGHEHDCEAACLVDGNYAVIGSMARAQLLRDVGAFRNEIAYEDWSAWLRMYHAGATVETIPDAIYIAHVRHDSRNRALSMDVKNRVHREIVGGAADLTLSEERMGSGSACSGREDPDASLDAAQVDRSAS
jgi:glycosyltransferase involved in cell wall biosynthesis